MKKFVFLLVSLFFVLGLYLFKEVDYFSQSTFGLPEAKVAETVYLKDGDSYTLRAHYVVKEIGNRKIRMIGYNGSVPGPFIRVEQGSEIKIKFINDIDVSSTIHSHGLRLDYRYDGTPGLTQTEVKPGESFEYVLKFKDSGPFWYHPHVREDYAQELGQYGTYFAEKKSTGSAEYSNFEQLIVDDILFDGESLEKIYKDKTNFALMGRFGNVMLVNGSVNPEIQYKSGSVVRFAITNTANARPFDLSIPGVKMKLVAGDLSDYARQKMVDSIIINPAERVVVDAYFERSGEYYLVHNSHDRSLGEKEYTMATFLINSEKVEKDYSGAFLALKENKELLDLYRGFLDKYMYMKPDKDVSIDLEVSGVDLTPLMAAMPCHKMPDGTWMGKCDELAKQKYEQGVANTETGSQIEKIHWEDHIFELNKKLFTSQVKWQLRDMATGKVNHQIDDWLFEVGQIIKIRLRNNPNTAHPMQHPFHMHGQRMMLLGVNGKPIENPVWKDTILVETGDTVDIVVEMSNPGYWMAHCHIAEHLTGGMMLNFTVEDKGLPLQRPQIHEGMSH